MHPKSPGDFLIIDWQNDGIILLDQRKLPTEEVYVTMHNVSDLGEAIKNMTVRGAPALGVAGAMGMALSAKNSSAKDSPALLQDLEHDAKILKSTRPTAVNLAWGVDRLLAFAKDKKHLTLVDFKQALIAEALLVKEQDIAANKRIGDFGKDLLKDGDVVLTHCNAGALCSAGFGTALGVIYAAVAQGKRISVYADETRPLLQGARLTAWELQKSGVPVTVITDSMAAHMMKTGKINKVITGADRIAANGDTANKIGTYGVAILAKYHEIPFYIAAPWSTLDLSLADGSLIPIEERDSQEVAQGHGKLQIPSGVGVRNPAFDVTPNSLITTIITDKGLAKPPFFQNFSKLSKT